MSAATNNVDRDDASNGYEAVAVEFMRTRAQSSVGAETVLRWARFLPGGASILDLGCGSGAPIASALCDHGFIVHGIDASRTLTDAFRRHLPETRVACEAVEDSDFFARTFDGVIAIGLIFLLPAEVQQSFLHKVATALKPDGRFLFTSPAQRCTWVDVLTGRPSHSLGAEAYCLLLEAAGLALVGEYVDEGQNHYYDTCRSCAPSPNAIQQHLAAPDDFGST